MKRDLNRLANTEFDLLIIGGGITGAFLAHDAVLRGLTVALVEKNDFGGSTSAASSKLLHGGIRYLPKGHLWKVRESYRETAIFQHIAPHLTRWLPFLIPTESTSIMKGKPAMQLAMALYGMCGAGLDKLITDPSKRPPARSFMDPRSAQEHARLLRSLPQLTGGQVLWESHMHNSERMTLAVLKTAFRGGAAIANHCSVRQLLWQKDRVIGAQVMDQLTGETFDIRARITLNSTGPHVQIINGSAPGLRLKRRLTGFSKGVHLVTRQLEPEYALALTTGKKLEGLVSRGGRHFFIIPWRGCSLIGTTNVPFSGNIDDIQVTSRDIDDFLAEINESLPDAQLTTNDIRYSFCGLYPLVAKDVRTDTYQGTGDYQVLDHEKARGVKGIITVLGAKYTTTRHVAESGINLAAAKLGFRTHPCTSAITRLAEGEIEHLHHFKEECYRQYRQVLPESLISELIMNHGKEIHEIIAAGRKEDTLQKVTAERNVLNAEIDHAIHHEMAITLDDLLFRRTGLGTIGHPGIPAITHCASRMADVLGWSTAEKNRQIALAERRYIYK
jgi:glycerol-3-phosphate dehydrogenase